MAEIMGGIDGWFIADKIVAYLFIMLFIWGASNKFGKKDEVVAADESAIELSTDAVVDEAGEALSAEVEEATEEATEAAAEATTAE